MQKAAFMRKKEEIRKAVLKKRSALSEQEAAIYSKRISEKIIRLPEYCEAEEIYAYMDYKNEVQTRALIKHALEAGKRVALPKVVGEELEFFYIQELENLKAGYRGIPEPFANFPAGREQAFILMPGVAFDSDRNRIGYGKGFYDRFLEAYPFHRTAALAFECQIVEKIPAAPNDKRPQIIVTEERIFRED